MRKLIFKDKEYKYSIGKAGIQIRPPDEPSYYLTHAALLGWTEEQFSQFKRNNIFHISPKTITNHLKGKPTYHLDNLKCECCKKKDKTVTVGFNPFYSEIYQKHHIVTACSDCFDEMAMDI